MRYRAGFTLLEVVLALSLAVLLLAGLYMALSTAFQQTRAGRRISNETAVVRAIFTRLTQDITSQLKPLDPRVSQLTLEPEDATTEKSTEKSTDKSTDKSAGPSALGPVKFNVGVKGDARQLFLTVSRLPDQPAGQGNGPRSDLRRIAYWSVGGGEQALGLARQELLVATAAEALSQDLPADEEKHLLAREVVEVTFSYYNGQSWQSSWDGSALDTEGTTPLGPPSAIEITLKLRWSDALPSEKTTRTYRHVVFLQAANGTMLPNAMGAMP